MTLYSYVVTHDTGFSPNPFWGYCTLANCKPAIRRNAAVGDWIFGLTSKALGNRLAYAMEISEVISYESYFRDPRFTAKIPNYSRGQVVYKCGDNIYEPLGDGAFRQLQSMHSAGSNEHPERKAHDLGGINVLISHNYYYFGRDALPLPEELHDLKVGRAHKCRFDPETVRLALEFIKHQQRGVNAAPARWPGSDLSWKQVAR